MRRSGRMSAVAVLFLLAAPASTLAQSASPGASSSPGLPSGSLSVNVPDGAAPAGVSLTVAQRAASERPDQLKAIPMEMPFYELQPTDVQLTAPATVTRSIPFAELGNDQYDPAFDGLIVGSLFTRDATGTWAWLEDAEVELDPAGGGFTISATTDHGGPILSYVPGSLLAATEDASATPVGQTFRVEGQLRVDPTSFADIADISGVTSDETIAKPLQSYDVEFFDRAKGLEYQCLAPGTVQYQTTFALSDVADVSPLVGAIGLGGTDLAVTQSGEHTCQ